jgi:hypothetical protein
MSCRAIVLLALLLPLAAAAHDPLPRSNWCAWGTPVEVGEIEYDGIALRERVVEFCVARTCGEFDDYTRSLGAVQEQCDEYEAANYVPVAGDFGDVIPLIDAPREFRDDNHHRAFRIEKGLRGTCVRCDGIGISPPPGQVPRH